LTVAAMAQMNRQIQKKVMLPLFMMIYFWML